MTMKLRSTLYIIIACLQFGYVSALSRSIAGRQWTVVKAFQRSKAVRRSPTFFDSRLILGLRCGDTSTYLQQSVLGKNDDTPSLGESYHLVWSQGFAKKFMVFGLGLAMLHFGVLRSTSLQSFLSSTIHGTLESLKSAGMNIVLPLLSSSCCLLQLIINVVVGAGGCAGFNTILGPFRPYLLSLLVYLNILTRPAAGQLLLRSFLALLPEIVHFWNRAVSQRWTRRFETDIVDSDNAMTATIELDIPSMGCVACINKIDKSLRRISPTKIKEASSWLHDGYTKKGGRAKVEFLAKSQGDVDEMTQTVIKTIERAGFDGPRVTFMKLLY